LLHDPELLILDEPANGLDPAGIVEMRDLLRRLAAQGKTVFISSHVLTEVQQICDRVAIINKGELVRLAAVSDLLGASGEFVVQVADAPTVLALLKRQSWANAARLDGTELISPSPSGRGRDLIRFLAEAGHWPDSVAPRHQNLEEIFLSLTGGAN
jgi:ABC-2 type transport system ATP-binding protein